MTRNQNTACLLHFFPFFNLFLVFAFSLLPFAVGANNHSPLLVPVAHADSNTATQTRLSQARLFALDAERRSLRSLSFNAEIQTPKPRGRFSRFDMTFAYQSPNHYRSEIIMGIEGRLLTVADGSRIWQQASRTRRVYVQDQATATANLRSQGPIDPISAIATPQVPLSELFRVIATSDSEHRIILDLEPLRRVPGYDQLRLTLTADGLTPIQVETYQRHLLVARVLFRDWRRNVSLPADRFRFTPPRGVSPIEIR